MNSWREDVADYAQDLTSTELEIFQKGTHSRAYMESGNSLSSSIIMIDLLMLYIGHRAAQAIAMWRKRQATHVHKSAVLDLVSSNSSAATTNRLKRGRED